MRIAVTETNVFEFSELSETAQQNAIDKAREFACSDSFWYECIIDDAKRLAAMIGIEIDDIFFSGFWSQGDGAQFTGRYEYRKGGAAELIAECPTDTELHAIAKGLQDVQRRNFYKLSATVKSTGRYSHAYCTAINVYRETEYSYCGDCDVNTEETVIELLRDYMHWIYRALEREYEYQTSDDTLREWLQDSGQEYTADGDIY